MTEGNKVCKFREMKFNTISSQKLIEVKNITDILENEILKSSPELLSILLKDQTRSLVEGNDQNILWATSDYESLGKGYKFHDQILPELITGKNGHVIMPRVLKCRDTVASRVREMAEVFTPAWICNLQNNQVDERWFGRKNVFNNEEISSSGVPYWTPNLQKIEFPVGRDWRDYVRDTRLEITCGEAPYLVSRYDAATGCSIPLDMRIGLLDRKLRVVGENTNSIEEWLEAAELAFKSSYAYEWQGDSLLIARESLLYSFIEYFRRKFSKEPNIENIKSIAYIISWNIWQMDGLRGVIPDTCHDEVHEQEALFGDATQTIEQCEGCRTGNWCKHNGIYCYIMDWGAKKGRSTALGKRIRYIDLMRDSK